MKGNVMKKVIISILGVVIALGLVLAFTPIDVKADAIGPHEPQAGDTVKDKNGEICNGRIISYVIPRSKIKSENGWEKDCKIYFVQIDSNKWWGLRWVNEDGGYWVTDNFSVTKWNAVIPYANNKFTKSEIDGLIAQGQAFYWIDEQKPQPGKNEHNHEWIEGIITSPTCETDGEEGIYCKSCGEVKESWPLSAFGYMLYEYGVSKINAAQPGQTIVFDFGEWNSFPNWFMSMIAQRRDVTFVFNYKWNHESQTITIPAGTPIGLNFEWYGPAKMRELYGMY